MSCFLNRDINTRFATLLLPQVKINTTDYTDSHRSRNKYIVGFNGRIERGFPRI